MSTTFYNTFSITISYGQNFGSLEYNIDIKNLWDIKTTSGSTKILAYLKTNGYGKNRMRSQRRLWPCVGRRPESDRPVESLGTHSVHLHTLYLNISTKIFISFKLHFLNLFNNIWCFLVYVIVQPIRK